jgi:ABC-type multidrug transport system ATPase subunit
MNDNILRVLMQLVALVAQYNRSQLHSNANVLIKTYLEQSQGRYNVRLHLKQFYDYFQTYLSENGNKSLKKNEEIDEEKVRSLCHQLASELQQSERIILFFSFLELINIDRRVTSDEYRFTDILAEEFKIDEEDYRNATGLIYDDPPQNMTKDDHVIVADLDVNQADELEGSWVLEHSPASNNLTGTIHRSGLNGKVYILRIKNANFYAIRYIGSDTVYLSKKKLVSGKFYTMNLYDYLRFRAGDPISFYDITNLFRSENNNLKLVLNGHDISIKSRSKNKKIIVHPFSFSEESGHIISLIGSTESSNALFQVFSAYRNQFEGKLTLNNYDYATEHFKLSKLLGYVPSKPIYQPDISIEKNLYLVAKLHFPSYSEAKLQHTIDSILDKCHLQNHRALIPSKALGTGLSGLHLRLLNLAVELIREPLLLAIENAVDDLSASDSEHILEILRGQLDSGCLVFISASHVSSSLLKYSERIWLFDDQGYIVYNGSSDEVFPYFQSFRSNFAGSEEKCPYCGVLNPDVLSQIIQQKVLNTQGKFTLERKISPLEWHLHYKEKIEKKSGFKECKKVLPIHPGNIPNIDLQYYVYSIKTYLSNLTRIRENLLQLMVSPLMAIVLAFIFRNDWSAGYHFGQNPNIPLFFITSILIHFFYGFVQGDRESRMDKDLLEHHLPKNISYFSYINAKITWLFPFSFISSLLYTGLAIWILSISGLFIQMWLLFFTVTCLGNILGILFFNIGKTFFKTYLFFGVYLVFCLVFSGSMIRFDQLPRNLSSEQYVPLLAELSPVRWAYEAIAVDQIKNNRYESNFYDVDKNITVAKFNANHLIPALQNFVLQYEHLTNNKKEIVGILKNELDSFAKQYSDIYPFEYRKQLTIEGVNPKIISEASDYLTYLQMHFFDRIRDLSNQRTQLEEHLIDSIGKNGYLELKNCFFNSFLFELQNWSAEHEKVIVDNGTLVKIMNPIFHVPESNLGRAHFFSPVKLFNKFYYETIWFNMFIIWVFVFIAYIFVLLTFFRVRPN